MNTLSYDAANRLTRMENGYGEVTTLSYDALGRETERLLANGVTSSRAYDAAGRETVVGHVVDDLALAWYTATYDAAGSRTGVVELDGTAVTYAHDALGQLTGEARGAVSTAFVYDPMGNRVTKTVDGATTTSTYNAANELTLVTPPTGPATTLTHDAAGNVVVEQVGTDVTTYTWDGEDRLTQVEGPDGTEEYAYDAEGLRVRKETAGGTVHYVLDGANVLIETDGSLVTQAVYTDLPGEWGRKLSMRWSGVSRFYLPDHQGHSRQLADAGGDVTDTLLCDAWGMQVMEAGLTVNPFAAFGQWGYYRDVPERLLAGTDWWRPEQAVWMGGQNPSPWPPGGGPIIPPEACRPGAEPRYPFPRYPGLPPGMGWAPPKHPLPLPGRDPFYGNYCGAQTHIPEGQGRLPARPKDRLDNCCCYHDQCFADHGCTAVNQLWREPCWLCNEMLCECARRARCAPKDRGCQIARQLVMGYACRAYPPDFIIFIPLPVGPVVPVPIRCRRPRPFPPLGPRPPRAKQPNCNASA